MQQDVFCGKSNQLTIYDQKIGQQKRKGKRKWITQTTTITTFWILCTHYTSGYIYKQTKDRKKDMTKRNKSMEPNVQNNYYNILTESMYTLSKWLHLQANKNYRDFWTNKIIKKGV